MAITTVQSNNKLIVFRKEITREYIRQNLFSPYIGTELTSIIRVINDLKNGGEQINIPLVARLKAQPISVGTLARAPLAGGAAREDLESVQGADWSPDGYRLAIVRESGGQNRLEYPPGRVLSEVPLPGAFLAPRVSPTGEMVAVLAFSNRIGSAPLVVLDRSGKKTLQMDHAANGFAWSAKGES